MNMVSSIVNMISEKSAGWFQSIGPVALYAEFSMYRGIAYSLLCVAAIVFALIIIRDTKIKAWDGIYFIIFCLAIFTFSLVNLICLFSGIGNSNNVLYFLKIAAFSFIPVALYMHARRQIAYNNIKLISAVLIILIPLVFAIIYINKTISEANGILQILKPQIFIVAVAAWYAVFAALALLNCIKVFFQMPAHMLKGAQYLLLSIIFMIVFGGVFLFVDNIWGFSFSYLALATGLLLAFISCRKSVASNVMITSRELLMGNLSTYVLVLSRDMEILDWNKKTASGFAPLPEPEHLENFESYKKRLMLHTHAKYNKNTPDMISTMISGNERQYFIGTREISFEERVFGYMVEIYEVTTLYSALRQFEDIATIDQLTGLYSRNAYMERVKTVIRPKNLPLVIIIGDVNGLKRVNDNFGHIAGDNLLSCVAEAIRQEQPGKAFASRIGGDEYVILLPRGTAEEADIFVSAVSRRLEQIHNDCYGTPTVSWGYAIMTSCEQKYNDVFQQADEIMYASKRKHHQAFRSSGLILDNELQHSACAVDKPCAENTVTEAAEENSTIEAAVELITENITETELVEINSKEA